MARRGLNWLQRIILAARRDDGPPPEPRPKRYLVTEDGRRITTEDGRQIILEDY